MKVSIIVPNRNYAQYLRECLDSIVIQTYQNIEVLLADGSSEDGSIEILDEYSERYGWKIYSYKDNGQVDAISRGLQLATGDIQCWLNSDDFFLSNKSLEKVVNIFQEYSSVDIVTLGGYYTDSIGHFLRPSKLLTHPLLRQSDLPRRGGGFVQPSTFWKSYVFQELGLNPNFPYSFDTYFFLRANIKFNLLIDQDMYISGYRLHESNMSLGIKYQRISELANLNADFFGFRFRFFYLKFLSICIQLIERIPFFSVEIKKMIYFTNNFLSYISFYLLPSI
jgi:glycosyltransferase involved in cell wall biosynthesis